MPMLYEPTNPKAMALAPSIPRTVPEEQFVAMVIQKDLEIVELKKQFFNRTVNDQCIIATLHRVVAKLEAEVAALKGPVDLGPGLASRINVQAQALNQIAPAPQYDPSGAFVIASPVVWPRCQTQENPDQSWVYVNLNCRDGFGPSDPAAPSVKPADPAPAKPPLPARALTSGSTMKIGTFVP